MEAIFNFISTIAAIFGALGISFVIEKSSIKINPLGMIKKFFVGDIEKRIDELTDARLKARTNEIKFELSNYEKLANYGVELSENDIAFVRDLYDEYHKDLNQNHQGTIMYNKIEDLYAKQKKKKNMEKKKKTLAKK